MIGDIKMGGNDIIVGADIGSSYIGLGTAKSFI
jgi:hypothetical protein